jgi:ParB family chromosome partitioning protein
MLEEMGRGDVRAGLLKKSDLIPWVEETAADKGWAPASLSWTTPPDAAAIATPEDEDPDGDRVRGDEAEPDDGAGAFEVTPRGEAALGAAA